MDQIAFWTVVVVAFGLLITERLRNDLVALLIILALAATGLLTPKEAVEGFSSEPALVVVAIFVLSAGMHQTGLAATIGRWIARLAGGGLNQAILVTVPTVAVLSAFTHHVTTTAMMLPVMLNLGREKNIPASKLLMPLSFAASLGTTITIIGAPAFLIASGVLQQAGRPGLGVFSIAPIGITLSIVGTLFLLLLGRFLLPDRGTGDEGTNRFRLEDYFTEVAVLPGSPFLGKSVRDIEADETYDVRVVGMIRRGAHLGVPRPEESLAEGDVLLVRTSPDQIVAFRQEQNVELKPVEQYESQTPGARTEVEDIDEKLVQAVIAPRSDLIGRTLGQIDFRRRYGGIVVGLWRREGWLSQELARIKLWDGDVLVIQGDDEAIARVADDPGFLMLVPFSGESRPLGRAWLAGTIMLATIIAASLSLLPLEIAAMAGAVAMVLTRCLSPGQAYRAIDAKIYVFIAGAIPLGAAMKKSGALEVVSQWLQGTIAGWSPYLVLALVFAVVAILTQFMSDAATTALFAPLATAVAQGLGHSPEAYVVTVAMAAVASFLTPIGHHGNLLVYGPGRYTFADFVRVGTPLTLVVGAVVVAMTPMIWPL